MGKSHENSEMSDARNNREMSSRYCSRPFLICIGANILLSCLILTMISLVFSGQNCSNEPLTESKRSKSTYDGSERAVLERFPGYFRTYEEQKTLERNIRYDIPVSDITGSTNCTNGLEKPFDTPWCDLTPALKIFHSCCVSDIKYVSPEYKEDYYGVRRKLAEFDQHKQFFRTEACSQVGGCQFCSCKMEEVIYSGVYDTEDEGSDSRYGVALFTFDGCCKCYS